MGIRVNNLTLSLDEDISSLKSKASKKIQVSENSFTNFKIIKESIDARRKDNIRFNYSVEFDIKDDSKIVAKINDRDVKIADPYYEGKIVYGKEKLNFRPIIVGMGPAGMFAGLIMAENGYKPIIIDRGENVEKRTLSVGEFWKNGKLNVESNVQFGEGGAGTFSDGKLTTRIKDSRCDYVLREFVKSGAPEEIIYSGKPHIGTDVLKNVVKNIRERIITLGGEVIFNSKLTDINLEKGAIKSIITSDNEIPCQALILSLGHSARDTYEMLFKKGMSMESKPFAIGVRIEHLQSSINESQYGKFAEHPKLKTADYKLTHTSHKTNRSIYSFCMCPGGYVVGASSEENRLVINGMSYNKRNGKNANSAIVVSVGPSDFGGDSPLKGVEFQRHYESLAYKCGKGKYLAPVQLLGDFMEDKVSNKIGRIQPSYKPDVTFTNLKECLPSYVVDTLKEGVMEFDKKLRGFACPDAVLTGIETRTSAPLRMLRNSELMSINLEGIYPAGEGAGYAGGIISAAVDGIKVAESIMKKYKPF